jgi:hypothetical protein
MAKIEPPDINAEGDVINSVQTYATVAARLLGGGSIVLGWGDPDALEHFDVLFTLGRYQYGELEEGLHAANTLFVSIMSIGAFGYKLSGVRKSPQYVADTLGLDRVSASPAADLINGVMDELLLEPAEERLHN